MHTPDFYPHPVRSITLRETHISMVFLTGDFVYKIKKPVDMDFLDFTTLEKRRHFCSEEVRLNRRLSSDVYLDVAAITYRQNRYYLNGPGPAVEYAVKMRQLPHQTTMVRLLRKGKLDSSSIDLLARILSQFHNRAKITGQNDAYGALKTVRENCEENFIQLEEFAGNTISMPMFLFIRSVNRSFLKRRRTLFKRRIEHRKIREGHGDLRAGHIIASNSTSGSAIMMWHRIWLF